MDALGFTKEWVELGIVTAEDIEALGEKYSTSHDTHPEHYRWRAFEQFLGNRALLDEATARSLYELGDLSLMNGEWPIIGQLPSWNRIEWPIPAFVRREELTENVWKVYYSDTNPNHVEKEERVSSDSALERDSMFGAGAAELLLTRLLT